MHLSILLLLTGCLGGARDDGVGAAWDPVFEFPPGSSCCAPTSHEHDLTLTQWPYSFGDATGDGIADAFVAIEGASDRALIGFIEGPLLGDVQADRAVLEFTISAHYDLAFRVSILGPESVAVSRVEHYPIPEGEVWLYAGSPTEPGWADRAALYLGEESSSLGGELFPVGDADGDGHPDVVIERGGEGLFLSGEGSTSPWSLGPTGDRTMSPGDVDGDGIREILISPDSDTVKLIYGPVQDFESPVWAGGDVLTFEGGPWILLDDAFAGGDFDGDGYDDITFGGYLEGSSHRSWVFRGPVESTDRERAQAQLLFPSGRWVEVSSGGDLDGDGDADLVANEAGAVVMLLAPFEGVLDMTDGAGCPAYDLLRSTPGAIDLDADGVFDLVVGADVSANEVVWGFLGPL